MKITKSQKEAIVNEISRRLEKERQSFTENFNKNYKFTKEEKEFLAVCKETEELNEKWENLRIKNKELSRKLGYPTYDWVKSDNAKKSILSRRIQESYPVKSVDYSEIRDKLEFATLDPSFNVEEFIKKYI
ncbi:MAG: hypothetical protein PUJ51_23350 [Clostridiales bacterium]|uniref:hypothetical protein n=1 Tax=Terrisporobacter sp. TaxID=1965305 RepID=UPI002A4ED983|nr:hypothetical protein [Terrisporobacter sp.]MDD7757387.1 hypothetical protein [Clostridiales bacterium]MDY4136534.1 hypothetical protein [Terrisporobacter sp.]